MFGRPQPLTASPAGRWLLEDAVACKWTGTGWRGLRLAGRPSRKQSTRRRPFHSAALRFRDVEAGTRYKGLRLALRSNDGRGYCDEPLPREMGFAQVLASD